MTKKQQMLENWINDTQLFQQIAGTKQTSREQLISEWNEMKKPKHKQITAENTQTQLIVLQAAVKAGEARRS